jgi:hypothetical protein
MLKIENAVTKIAVDGPKSIRLAREIAGFTETLPVRGSDADRLSAVNASNPNSTTPTNDISLYLKRI